MQQSVFSKVECEMHFTGLPVSRVTEKLDNIKGLTHTILVL
jgi:hypothetical protein